MSSNSIHGPVLHQSKPSAFKQPAMSALKSTATAVAATALEEQQKTKLEAQDPPPGFEATSPPNDKQKATAAQTAAVSAIPRSPLEGVLRKALDTHLKAKEYTNALVLIESALQNPTPSILDLYLMRADIICVFIKNEKLFPEALKDLNQVVAQAGKNSPLLINALKRRAQLHLEQYENHLALLDYNTLISMTPNSIDFRICRGILHYNEGRYQQAKKDFQAALEINKGSNALAVKYLRNISFHETDGEAAKEAIAKSIMESAAKESLAESTAQSNDPKAKLFMNLVEQHHSLLLAELLYYRGKLEASTKLLDFLSLDNRSMPLAMHLKAKIAMQNNHSANAMSQYKHLKTSKGSYTIAILDLGKQLQAETNFDAAVKVFNLIEGHVKSSEVMRTQLLMARARAYFDNANYDQALEDCWHIKDMAYGGVLRPPKNIDPGYIPAFEMRALIHLIHTGDRRKFKLNCDSVIESGPAKCLWKVLKKAVLGTPNKQELFKEMEPLFAGKQETTLTHQFKVAVIDPDHPDLPKDIRVKIHGILNGFLSYQIGTEDREKRSAETAAQLTTALKNIIAGFKADAL